MIIFQFPPLAGGGVPRPLGFVRHLRSYGWEPVVVTVRPQWLGIMDHSLLELVPSDVTVVRTFAWPSWMLPRVLGRIGLIRSADYAHRILFPDQYIGWMPGAYAMARKIISSRRVDMLWTTSLPFSSFQLGIRLAQATGKPWIADFRDNWLNNAAYTWPTRDLRQRAEAMLRRGLQRADRLITVSDAFADEFRALCDDPDKVDVLPNGFDRFASESMAPKERGPVFTLSFTGTFYASIQPDHLFDALRLLLQRGEIPAGEIRLQIAGRNMVHVPDVLLDVVECLGYVEYVRARSIMEMSSVLVLILGREFTGCYSCKLPEYLASGRYVLGLVPEGSVAASLIRKSGAGVVVSPDDPEAIARNILALYKRWKNGETQPVLNNAVVEQFGMPALTQRLAGIFDSVIEQRSERK